MPLSDIMRVSISAQTQGITQQGFSDALILGAHNHWTDRVHIYGNLSEMVADGFATTDPEYRAAMRWFSQTPTPARVYVGRRANRPTLHWTLTPVVGNSTVYRVKVNGDTATYTSDSSATAAEITAGLAAAIDGLSEAITVTANPTTVTFEANAVGAYHYVESLTPTTLLVALDHADAGVAADLDAILLENDDWYGLIHCYNSVAEGMAAAAWVEANKKFFLAQTSDTAAANSTTTDLLAELQNAAYARTVGVYHPDPIAFNDAAWMATVFPYDPGSRTWKFKTPAGVSLPALNATQRANLRNKNGNFLDRVLGTNIMVEGKTASGAFADITHGVDWLTARIQEEGFRLFISEPKIPMTDGGLARLEAVVRGQLSAGIGTGFLADDPEPTVTVPKYSDIPENDRANRIVRGITFTARVAGAIHEAEIVGEVTI